MGEDKIFEKIVSYIEDHLEEDLSLDTIAETLNYSKFYIARTFAQQTGLYHCTPQIYRKKGIFEPKQPRLSGVLLGVSSTVCMISRMGGRMAA